jgi:hypothetical protein
MKRPTEQYKPSVNTDGAAQHCRNCASEAKQEGASPRNFSQYPMHHHGQE